MLALPRSSNARMRNLAVDVNEKRSSASTRAKASRPPNDGGHLCHQTVEVCDIIARRRPSFLTISLGVANNGPIIQTSMISGIEIPSVNISLDPFVGSPLRSPPGLVPFEPIVPVLHSTGPTSAPVQCECTIEILRETRLIQFLQTAHAGIKLTPAAPQLTFDESSLAEFLNDIMMPLTPDQGQGFTHDPNSLYAPRDFLNFGIDNLDFDDVDFTIPILEDEKDYQRNVAGGPFQPTRSGTRTPAMHEGIRLSTAAFTRSLWRWTPTKKDHGFAEQGNLVLPYTEMQSPETQIAADLQLVNQRLELNARDKILAMVLGTCNPDVGADIARAFPNLDLLNDLLYHYFSFQLTQLDSWIHLPTLKVNEQSPEFLAIAIAAGAVSCPVSNIRKLGFALQEAVRLALAKKACLSTIPMHCASSSIR